MRSFSAALNKTSKSNFNMNISRFFAAGIKADNVHVIKKVGKPTPLPALKDLAFGQSFSDHMIEVDWDSVNGWHTPTIKQIAPFAIHPAASSIHYALQCFEGMKAFKDSNNDIRIFRPEMNMTRLRRSCARLSLPDFDGEEVIKLMERLLDLDHSFIPNVDGYSIYLRPAVIATQPTLGVSPPNHAKLFVLACPVGPYYPTGFKPVSLYADANAVRAWPGGSGDAKLGSNYAPTIHHQRIRSAQGWSQILWMLPHGDDFAMTEVGTMNMFLRWISPEGKHQLITPPLDGVILPGITRDSILTLAKSIAAETGVEVVEREVLMKRDFIPAIQEGRILEAFGTGTAAVISPIDKIGFMDQSFAIPLDPNNKDAGIGPYAKNVLEKLWDIQYGRTKLDNWSRVVPKVTRQ